jgi:CRP-like cAMP-binding protein
MAVTPMQVDDAPGRSGGWSVLPGSGRPGAEGALLLDADPALAHVLSPEDRRRLAPLLRVRTLHIDPGPWPVPAEAHGGSSFGLLVLDGLLLRDLTVHDRSCAELLGPGDLLRPGLQPEGPGASVQADAMLRVLTPTVVAVLDLRASTLIGRFPALVSELLDRTLLRARTLQFQLALTQVSGIDSRLQLLLWHFADRWGRVTPEGVVVPLDLTHEMLGRLIGARRPSVTTALRAMTAQGVLARREGEWVLRGDPDEETARTRELAGTLARAA